MATVTTVKRHSVCYKYDCSTTSLKEGVSATLKEMSMQLEDEDERRRMYALLTLVVTVVFHIFLGSAAFVCAAVTDSSAGYAFALDCLLDVIAATLVVWRFYGTDATYSNFKEHVACICLGILFCLASVGICSKSVHDLVVHHAPQQLVYVFILATVGGIMSSVLGCTKYMLGKRMRSQALILEAINTCLSAVLSMMLAVSDILYFYHPSAWTIDPITSIVVAIILFVGGIRTLCKRERSEENTPLLVGVAV